MSRHIPRSARWSGYGPNEHRSAVGRVYYRSGQWWAEVSFQTLDAANQLWQPAEIWSLGRFKRPRNAMMAVEDRAQELQNRHGSQVRFLDWSQGQATWGRESSP